MATKTVFCAAEQKEVDHDIKRDVNGEWLLTCEGVCTHCDGTGSCPCDNGTDKCLVCRGTRVCGRTLKLPLAVREGEVDAHVHAHKEANVGQVPIPAH